LAIVEVIRPFRILVTDVNYVRCGATAPPRIVGVNRMSKGMDRKKEQKKKPAKTLEEKRAAKREKQQRR
jgi:hypothetical protein